jgi:outer membrane cobalamin receptor
MNSQTRYVSAVVFGCALVWIATCTTVLAADLTGFISTDSTSRSTKRFQEISVVASRITDTLTRAFTPVTVLNAQTLQTLGARQISDALTFVPGVFMRNYGGLGGLKTMSLRGANAAQTLVLIDGVRLNSSQNGQVDFSTVPVSMLEDVEVLRGGAAALYGASALGGVVNIRTKRLQQSAFGAKAELASFGELGVQAHASLPLAEQWTLSANGEAQHARGNFPFVFNEFGQNVVLERQNGDFTTLNARLQARGILGGWSANSHVLARTTERGAPGAVVQGSVEQRLARLDERELLVYSSWSRALPNAVNTPNTLQLLASWRNNILRYRDPDARFRGTDGIDERFVADDVTFRAHLRSAPEIIQMMSYDVAAEAVYSLLRGMMLQPNVGNAVSRLNVALNAKAELKPFAESAVLQNVAVQAAVRAEYFSDFGAVLSPLAGLAWLPNDDERLRLRLQWSYNFRPPSFNELYYLNFGNANLKPERANAVNAGFTWKPLAETLTEPRTESLAELLVVEADAFAHRTEHQIVAIPTSPVTWTAQNVGLVETFGAETSIRAALLNNALTTQWTATLQQALDATPDAFTSGRQLVYTPNVLATGMATFSTVLTFGSQAHEPQDTLHLHTGSSLQYTGLRYSLPSNSPESVLAPFVVVNVYCEVSMKAPRWSAAENAARATLKARLQCDNCLDEHYAVMRNFPMPSRAIRFSLAAEW